MDAALADAEAKHLADIGLTEDGVCRKAYVPYEVKADEDSRRVSFTITTGAVDRDNDTINVDGWDLKHYLKNPVVLFGHRSDMPPIAKALSVKKSAGALHATAEFLPAGVYPLADQVYEMVKLGFLRATSVGFRPKRDKSGRPAMAWNEERGGIDFEEQELLEFSIVPVPSNPEALMERAKDFASAGRERMDAFRKALDLAEAALGKPVEVKVGLEALEPLKATFTREADGAQWGGHQWSKAGRRLSQKTEASLRNAHKAASDAVGHLQEALGDAEDELEEGKSAPVLMVTPSPAKTFLVNPDDVKAAVVAAVAESVQSAVNRARGRLD